MDKSKYISKEETLLIKQSMNEQIKELKEELSNKSNICFKDEIKNVSVMMEVGDIDGDE